MAENSQNIESRLNAATADSVIVKADANTPVMLVFCCIIR